MKKRQGRRKRKSKLARVRAKPSTCSWCEHKGATIEHVEGSEVYKLHPACRTEMLSWLAHRAAHAIPPKFNPKAIVEIRTVLD